MAKSGQLATILNVLAIAAASMAHVMVGVTVRGFGGIYRNLFSDMGNVELPVLSRMVMEYTGGVTPIVVGLVLALSSAVGLGALARSDRGRGYLPFGMALSFLLALMHFVQCFFWMSLPLTRIMTMMNP